MFVVGTSFKYDQVELFDVLPNVPTSALPSAHQDQTADLYAISGYVLMNHPCGLFARADATWYKQRSTGYNPSLPGDDFFQENIFLGYRFFRRRIEVTFGILNLSNEDYHLNPLNTYAELPRERTYTARLSFIF